MMNMIKEFIIISFAKAKEYKFDFFMIWVYMCINLLTTLIFWLIVNQNAYLPNWTYQELIIYTLILDFSQSIGQIGFGITQLPYALQSGEFDLMMIKPLSPILFLIGKYMNLSLIIQRIITTSLLLIISFHIFLIELAFSRVLVSFIMVLMGVFIYQMFNALLHFSAFWLKKVDFITNLFYSLDDFQQYPLDLFDKLVRYIFTLVIPFALICYYPSLVLLNKTDIQIQFLMIYLGVFIAFLLITRCVYQRGVSKYESFGG